MTSDTSTLSEWPAVYDEYVARMGEIQAAGQWVHGPRDLMRIIGVDRVEVLHSKAIGWLLDPGARHGLHSRLLAEILRVGWPADPPPDLAGATVSWEIPLQGTRADIVVRCGDLVIVLENKVDASERPRQCQDLYDEWVAAEPGSDLRFLLLTLDGHRPASVCTGEAAAAWRSMSYPSLAAGVRDALAGSGEQRAVARHAAEQYLATIDANWGVADVLAVRIGEEGDAREC